MRVDKIQPDFQKTEGTVKQREEIASREIPQKHETSPLPLEERLEDKLLSKNSLKDLTERVNQLNETLRVFDKRLRFDIHEETNRVMVQVLDAETDEILREIPPEKILDMVASIEEAIGLIVDERI